MPLAACASPRGNRWDRVRIDSNSGAGARRGDIPEPVAQPVAQPVGDADVAPTSSPAATPTPSVLPADLTGVVVPANLAHRLPIAVLIDDNRVARPQSGFNATSIVYQAPADGGETRYMLVFQEGDTPDIGPVRSGRLYFVHWAAEYRSAVAHYGGDRQTLSWIRWSGGLITNLDALAGSGLHSIGSRVARPLTMLTRRLPSSARWRRRRAGRRRLTPRSIAARSWMSPLRPSGGAGSRFESPITPASSRTTTIRQATCTAARSTAGPKWTPQTGSGSRPGTWSSCSSLTGSTQRWSPAIRDRSSTSWKGPGLDLFGRPIYQGDVVEVGNRGVYEVDRPYRQGDPARPRPDVFQVVDTGAKVTYR